MEIASGPTQYFLAIRVSELVSLIGTVQSVETQHCDAGWRNYHFVRVETDEEMIGWSEFDDNLGATGITTVVEDMASTVIGEQVNDIERIRASRPPGMSVIHRCRGYGRWRH
jgi:L-alanine-DL-glutamate epimerase-like enolase superfamily enzyme